MHLVETICEKCGCTFTSRVGHALCRKCRPKTNSKITIICSHCGAEFEGLPDTLYCRKCVNSWTPKQEVACEACGALFNSYYGETKCTKCRHNERIARSSSAKKCMLCGKTFKAVYPNEMYCADCKGKSNHVESICVVCGKHFIPKRTHCECKTCSRKCQGLYIQNAGLGMKYNTEDLHKRIVDHIIKNGAPLSIDDLGRDLGGITRKVFSARGWTVRSLLKDAGILDDWVTKGTSVFERSVYYIIRSVVGEDCAIETQKIFDDLIGATGGKPRFDFYLPDFNLVIETDGRQHYDETDPWHSAELEENDRRKNEYCFNKGISLLRIRYYRWTSNKQAIKDLLIGILPPDGEIRPVHCFNCWNGLELMPIPISNQASDEEEGSQTIPEGSTPKWVEMGSTLTDNAEGEDIVDSAGNT